MGHILDKFNIASGGNDSVQQDWIPATALRPLIHDDPCLIWLQHHGAKHGFARDDEDEYSFLKWIGEKGRAFEDAWIRNTAGSIVMQVLGEDHEVRSATGLRRTLETMESDTQVITKAGLWWAPEQVYGFADILCRSSWLYKKFPHLRPKKADEQPDHWIVIDAKFQTGLRDEVSKKHDYEAAATQVRIYSYIIGKLTGIMPKRAFLATRDCPLSLVEVEVPPPAQSGRLPLDIAALRDECLAIKLKGADWLPWTHERTAPNFTSHKNAPWSQAVKQIAAKHYKGGPLESLPGIGRKQAEALTEMGYGCVDDVLPAPPDAIVWEDFHGIGDSRAMRLKAVLESARTNTPSTISIEHVPPKVKVELFLDFEFLSNANADFDGDWPAMRGCEMIFMAGVGWEADSTWHYKQFVAEREDPEAERELFQRLLRFLKGKGVFDPERSAALYHWSPAEVWQAKRAAERHNLPDAANLPWVDLRKSFTDGAICVPGAWGLGIKEVANAIGQLAPKFKTEWPRGLAAGLSAMVAGWVMYARGGAVAEAPEMETLTNYLEADVKALCSILGWLRASSCSSKAKCATASTRSIPVTLEGSLHWWKCTSLLEQYTPDANYRNHKGWYRCLRRSQR